MIATRNRGWMTRADRSELVCEFQLTAMRRNKRLELKCRWNGSTYSLFKFRQPWELFGVIRSSLFSALGSNIPLFMSIYDSSFSGAFNSN